MKRNTSCVPKPINKVSAVHINCEIIIHYFDIFPALVPLIFNLGRVKEVLLICIYFHKHRVHCGMHYDVLNVLMIKTDVFVSGSCKFISIS